VSFWHPRPSQAEEPRPKWSVAVVSQAPDVSDPQLQAGHTLASAETSEPPTIGASQPSLTTPGLMIVAVHPAGGAG
jgi:hypothetical protein